MIVTWNGANSVMPGANPETIGPIAATEGAAFATLTGIVIAPGLGGSKARKKIRGPYSDPSIYEAYIARCIAEREKPRINVEVALIKEALVHEVEQRRQTEYAEYDALVRENQLLERLLAFERTKRNLAAIAARQRQIAVQIEEVMEQEAQSIIMLLDEM